MWRLFAVLALCAVGASCQVSLDYSGTGFRCSLESDCPAGQQCVNDACQQPGIDAGSDAAPADAPPVALLASCADHLADGATTSGVYSIDPPPIGDPIEVYCDMNVGGGGWTLLVNNNNTDAEPEGCRPRLATAAGFECGTVAIDEDFALATGEIEFTELLFAAYTDQLEVTSYRLFRWDTPQTLPDTEQWEMIPDDAEATLPGSTLPLISCAFATIGEPGLRRLTNTTVRVDTGAYLATDVVTFLDQDLLALNPGRLSFTDVVATTGSVNGLDDFQDGFGCNDVFSPLADRGSSAFIAVR